MLSAPPFQGQEFLAASFISRKICGRWWADFQLIVDLMAALSYVKEDQVLDYYDQVIEPLIQKLPNTIPEAALDYVDYFERTYVGRRAGRNGARRGPIFKPDLWSIFPDLMEDMPTTNNALEAFNAQWNASDFCLTTFGLL